jgi:hypothetical protein
MNCSIGTCAEPAEVREPLPLCGTDALRVIAAYAEANLTAGSRTTRFQNTDTVKEIGTTYPLLGSGQPTSFEWNAITTAQALTDLDTAATAIRTHQAARPEARIDCQIRLELPEHKGTP